MSRSRVEMTYGYPPIATEGTTVYIAVENDVRPLSAKELELVDGLREAAEFYLHLVAHSRKEAEVDE